MKDQTNSSTATDPLVDSETLLSEIFPDEKIRPSARWLASMRERRLLPFYKLGGKVLFRASEVRQTIERSFKVKAVF